MYHIIYLLSFIINTCLLIMSKNIIKLCIVGDANVGKTTFVNRIRKGDFITKYFPTHGVMVNPIEFYTSMGNVIINTWDCAGDEKLKGLDDGYYIGANIFIVMFDLTSKSSLDKAQHYIDVIRKNFDNNKIILCGNKNDCRVSIPINDIQQFISKNKFKISGYYNVSAKTNYNYEKPFLQAIRLFYNNKDIVFTNRKLSSDAMEDIIVREDTIMQDAPKYVPNDTASQLKITISDVSKDTIKNTTNYQDLGINIVDLSKGQGLAGIDNYDFYSNMEPKKGGLIDARLSMANGPSNGPSFDTSEDETNDESSDGEWEIVSQYEKID